MKKIILLAFVLGFLTKVSAIPNDTVAIKLCQQAENAYTGTNGAFLNKEKAFQLYKQAAEREYAPAILKVAGFYYRGEVVEKSPKDYLSWVLKAAEIIVQNTGLV